MTLRRDIPFILYRPPQVVCRVIEELEDDLLLVEPLDGDEDDRFEISLSDPAVLLDPTEEDLIGKV